MKIGITANHFKQIHANGIKMNTMLWYDFIEKCGHTPVFVFHKKEDVDTEIKCNKVCIDKFLNENKAEKKEGESHKDYYKDLFDFDVVLFVGLYSHEYHKALKTHGVKTIMVSLGSTYHNDVHCIVDKNWKQHSKNTHFFDEVWISPHFKFSKEYLKVRYGTDKVFVCPYFWRDDLFKDFKDKILHTTSEELKVAIVEPNLEQAKNCIPAIAICEKAVKSVNKVMVFNANDEMKKIPFLLDYANLLTLTKEKKISFENRIPLSSILTKYCNCVVSFVEDCDLNYVFLECFYLGVPLVHNSVMLKEYGYYYPALDVTEGAEQLEKIVRSHNPNKYIKKHKKLIDKYSIDNPVYISWVNSRLKEEISYDCD